MILLIWYSDLVGGMFFFPFSPPSLASSYTHALPFRVCPGRELADHTLFLTIASSLSVFDVLPPTGPDGKPIRQNFRYQTGLVVGPEHFEANIKLRPGKTEEFLSTALLEQPYNKGDSEALKDVPWARRPKN